MMTSNNTTDIKIKLINNDCTFTDINNNWKRISTSFKISLNQNEPNINKLIELEAEAKIVNSSYIITPTSSNTLNSDKTNLSGFCIGIDLAIIENIMYEESVNGHIFTITKSLPLSTFIVLDATSNLNEAPIIHVCIEDIQIQSISSNEIINQVTLFIQKD